MKNNQLVTKLHKEMAKGYMEMGELNLELANEGNVFEYEMVYERAEGEAFKK